MSSRCAPTLRRLGSALTTLLAATPVLLAVALPATADSVTFVASTPIAGDSVPVTVTLADAPEPDAVEISVSIAPGSGDLLGLFGNVVPESLVPGLTVVDATGVVTQWQAGPNQVWKVGGGNVMSPVKTWDWGVRFGQAGSGGGAIHAASFRLTASGLTAASLADAATQGWRLGVRIQGTSGPEGSAKIGIAASQPPQGQAPTVAIAAPAEGALLATSQVAVSGSFTGTAPVAVAVNGIGATLTGPSFSAILVLPDGPQTLTATASNASGSASDAVAVTVDTAPPVVTIANPPDATMTAAATVTVTGTVVDASPITSFTLNGLTAPLANGAFVVEVPLAMGGNPITAVATDAAGHSGSAAISVERGAPPTIAIATPPSGFTTTDAEIVVTGQVSGSEPLAVVVGAVPASVAAGTFSATIPLSLGSNAITATVSNPFGTASASVSGTRTGAAPPLSITIDSPPSGALVSSPLVGVAGWVSDGTASVAVGGTTAIVTGNRYLAPAVQLVEGENTLVAIATRGADSAQAETAVTYNAPPRVVITTPADGSVVRFPQTDVEGIVDDPAAFVDVNGRVAAVGPGGRFVARNVPLDPGPNLLAARAIDVFGASGEDSAEVTREDDAAGVVRLVFVREERYPFLGDGEPIPLIAETVEQFEETLSFLGFPPEEFSPPIARIQHTYGDGHVFAFAEDPGSLSVFWNDEFRDDQIPLEPIELLPDDFVFRFGRLDPTLIPDILPSGFDARYYARLDLSIEPESRPSPGDLLVTAETDTGAVGALPIRIDIGLPAVEITHPVFGSVVRGNAVTISGTASDDGHLSGRARYHLFNDETGLIGSGSVPVVNGRFVLNDLAVGEGQQCVTVTALDAAGNSEGDLTCFTVDTSGRLVSLASLRDGQTVVGSTLAVSLDFAVPLTLVSVNGVADGRAFAAGLAEQAITVSLAPGPNVITLVVDDGSGPSTFEFALFRLGSPDPIQITNPGDGAVRNTAAVPVTVRAPLGTSHVQINGVAATLQADGVSFVASVPLRSGTNRIEAIAAPFGQTTAITVEGDFQPPFLHFVLPPDGTVVAADSSDLVGSVDESVSVELEGPAGRRRGTALFDSSLSDLLLRSYVYRFDLPSFPLAEGVNALTLRLRDMAGNETSETLTLERATSALSLVAPSDGSSLPGTRVVVQLQALTGLTIDAWYAGERRLAGFDGVGFGPGSATFADVPLAPGSNEMRIAYRRADGAREVLLFDLHSTASAGAVISGIVQDLRTGGTVAGALVRIAVNDITLVVATDAEGRYRAEVEAGDAVITVEREGFLAATATLAAAGETSFDFALVPWSTSTEGLPGAGPGVTTSRVEGVVTDGASGSALAGVAVTVSSATTEFVAVTDIDGAYVVEAIPAGRFTVAFERPGYLPQLFEVPFDAPVDWTLDAALEATAGSGLASSSLSGRVFDEDTGAGLGWAAITVDSGGTILMATSEASGEYLIEAIPPGPSSVTVALDGFVTRSFEVPFEEAAPIEVDVPLVASGASGGAAASVVRGTIRDAATGAPLAGALVTVTATGATLAATADGAGAFAVRGIPIGAFTVTVSRDGYVPRVFDAPYENAVVLPLDATLSPLGTTATVVGTVRSGLTGQLEPGVTARLLGTSRTAESDATGRFTLTDVPLGVAQSLVLSKPTFLEEFVTFTATPGPADHPVPIDLTYPVVQSSERSLAIGTVAEGTVVDALTRRPIAGAEVQAGTAATVADADGRFTLSGLPLQAVVRVTATAPDHEPQGFDALVVANGDDLLDFRLAPTLLGEVAGTVTDATTGAPIADAEVGIEGSTFLSTVADGDGTYRLLSVPAGSHTIVARSPEHFPQANASLAVSAGSTVPFDAALPPRPKAGGLAGRVLDATTGAAISGALLTLSGGRSDVSAADGSYGFSAVPSGLARVTIEAAGYPAVSRVAPVDADVDAATPTVTTFDFRLDAGGAFDPSEASRLVEASVGGSIETPDGRMRLDIPPGSLTGDGVITIRKSSAPVAGPGETIASDPALALPPVTALAEEVEILVGAPPGGGDKPLLAGPVYVVARYFEEVAESTNAAEASAFPYLHTGQDWTALRMVPYLHAVDRINNVVVTALIFGETESGRDVVAYQTPRRPMMLAQVGGGLGGIVADAFRLIVSSVARTLSFDPAVAIVDLSEKAPFNEQRATPPFYAINTHSRPLFVTHGWDPLSILRDSALITDPIGADQPRYGQIVRDLVESTNAIYRPIWLTYNSRLGIDKNGQRLVNALRERYPEGTAEEPLLADAFGPPNAFPNPKVFRTFDSYGYSMGGLMNRSFQVGSYYSDPPISIPGDSGRRGRIQRMIAMGSPHHGALQVLRLLVSVTSVVYRLPIEPLLNAWSPGTADLLDYLDDEAIPCAVSGNPTLCELNRDRRSSPHVVAGLIAGTKSTASVAGGVDLDLGYLVDPTQASDSVVPISSAHGESTLGRRVVPALTRRRTTAQVFDHFRAGTDATAQGEGNQRITAFVETDMLPVLQDHWVVRDSAYKDEQDRPLVILQCPTEVLDGRVVMDMSFDYKAKNGGLTGLTLVTYAEDAEGNWHIVHGADSATLEFDSGLIQAVGGRDADNSLQDGPILLRVDEEIPAGVDARRMLTLVGTLGELSATESRAAEAPSERQIEVLESLERVIECP